MTVSTATALSGPLTGNGSTTVFPFTFKAASSSEVQVLVDGVVQSSGYTVAVNAGDGGSVTFAVAPASGAVILIVTNPAFTQEVSFENAGSFLPEDHDLANDRAAIRDIQLSARISRSFLVPWGEAGGTLPAADARANMFLKFDEDGAVIVGTAEGETGPPPNLVIGTVTGLAAGASPTVGITGATPNYTLNFGIPKGDTGSTGASPTLTFGAVTTGAAGSSASVSVVDLGSGAYRLDFTIPRGATGASGALSDGTFGDVVVSSSGAVITVGNDKITYAKMQNVSATARLLGRNTAGAGDVEELDAATVKTMLSLGNVTNTSDANKPVSTAQQTALNLKADANDAALTGNPTAPTAAERDADTSIATTAFVDRLYDIDQVAKTSAYTLTLANRGLTVSTNSAVHVPPNASVAFPIGAFVEIYNASNASITVDFSSGTDVFRKHGSTSTVTTLTLAARSIGQLRKPDIATEWLAIGFS